MKYAKVLCTGLPGVGKTTLVMRGVEALGSSFRASGFTTEEIKGQKGRTGFMVRTMEGRTGMLATAQAGTTGPRVGRYLVDITSFEAVALPSLRLRSEFSLYVIDEIGKMECLSERFVQATQSILDAPVSVLATAPLHGKGFIERLKLRPDVALMEVTHENRDHLARMIANLIRTAGISQCGN